jgi:hypothetical protein
MGRIRRAIENAASEVSETSNVAEAILIQVSTEGIKVTGTLRLFKLPSFLAKLFGKDYFEIEYDTIIKINDKDEVKVQDETVA